jgi:photosystem II stability/assembly factor-like uncharacterized protein
MTIKNKLSLLFIFLCLTSFGQKYQSMINQGTYTIASIESEANKYFEINGTGRGSGYKQFKRWLYVANRDIDENGFKRSNHNQMKALRSYRRAAANKRKGKNDQTLGGSLTGSWQEVGPTNWSASTGWTPGVGRITSIAIDPNNANHILVGSPTGGVWKSTDAGVNWAPLTDQFQTMDVYSLAISPHNPDHYLWGELGEVYKSVDAGATWTSTNSPFSLWVNAIVYHPTDPNVVLACSSFDGLSRSTDGGSTWTMVSSVASEACYDIEFKPGDPNVVYVSGTNVYKSTNAGLTFLAINGSWGTGAKMMAVTPDNPEAVYIAEGSGRFVGLHKSTNSGISFTQLRDNSINYFGYESDGSGTRGQAPRDMEIIVSPTDENEVHLGGIQTWKSTNGGQSFSLTSFWRHDEAAGLGVGYIHADVDIMVYKGSRIYLGTDGGFYTSDDQAATFNNKTLGMGLHQYYRIGVSKTDPNVVVGGSQDNGTCVMHGANRDFKFWIGGDGSEAFVDWSDPNNLYGTSNGILFYKSSDQGNSIAQIAPPESFGANIIPFEQDPVSSNTMYMGYSQVYKSTNSGGSWTSISSLSGGYINELKIAASNNQYIYASKYATLHRTTDGGSSWTTLSGISSRINSIAVDPDDEQRIAVVTSSNVYVSTNAGNTWTDYTKNLPVGPAYYCAVWQKGADNGLYVGGNGFVSYIDDNMTNYVDFLDALPNVRVYELEIQYVSNKLFAGTYGRGLWESDLYGTPGKDYDAAVIGITDVSSTLCGNSANPTVTIENKGQITLSAVVIKIYLDGVLTKTVAHTTSLTTGQSEQVSISGITFPTEGTVILKAEVSNPNGQADEDAVNDNKLMGVVVTFGQPYSSVNGGPVDNTFGPAANYNNDNGLYFDVLVASVLESVKVYADGAGDRTVEIKNSTGTVVFSKTVTLPHGESRMQLDASLPAGTSYRIGINGNRNLYRNSSGPSYPYSISNLMSITSSTAAGVELDYYYFFYDWQVKQEGCAVLTSIEELSGNIWIYPNPVKNQVNIEGEFKHWTLTDSKGAFIKAGTEKVIDVGGLPLGLYYLNVDGEVVKFIKN